MSSKIQSGKMNNGRAWIVLAAVSLVGLVAFQSYKKQPVDVKHAQDSTSIQTIPATAVKTAAVKGVGVTQTPAAGVDRAAAHKDVSAASNGGAAVARSAGNRQTASNVSSGSALMLQSVRASRDRVRKLASAQRSGMTMKQRNAQLNYQVISTRRSLDLARNQLRQIQQRKTVQKPGSQQLKKAGSSRFASIPALKSRIKQLQQRLSARQAALRQSRQQLAMISRYPGGPSPDAMPAGMAHHSHHRF